VALIVVFGLGGVFTLAAFANNPRFTRATSDFVGSGADLQVSFTEVGLGSLQSIDYEVSASATAVYVCVNGGGHNPPAANKITIQGPVEATAQFTADRQGRIVAGIALHPPGPGSFSCPQGQRLILASIHYVDDPITDLTNGVSQPIPGDFSRTFFP
jgi:hypothetical protein